MVRAASSPPESLHERKLSDVAERRGACDAREAVAVAACTVTRSHVG